MKYLLALLLLFPMTACAQEEVSDAADPLDVKCETYVEWMNQPVDNVDLTVLGDRPHRVLAPDSMATMDYNPERLNIHTTDDGIIIQQDCG